VRCRVNPIVTLPRIGSLYAKAKATKYESQGNERKSRQRNTKAKATNGSIRADLPNTPRQVLWDPSQADTQGDAARALPSLSAFVNAALLAGFDSHPSRSFELRAHPVPGIMAGSRAAFPRTPDAESRISHVRARPAHARSAHARSAHGSCDERGRALAAIHRYRGVVNLACRRAEG
jgi:hypothetical protein